MDQVEMLRNAKKSTPEDFIAEIVKLRKQKVERVRKQKAERLKCQKTGPWIKPNYWLDFQYF